MEHFSRIEKAKKEKEEKELRLYGIKKKRPCRGDKEKDVGAKENRDVEYKKTVSGNNNYSKEGSVEKDTVVKLRSDLKNIRM